MRLLVLALSTYPWPLGCQAACRLWMARDPALDGDLVPMRLISLLNHCQHFPGFVYEKARLSPDNLSIEIDVRARRGSKPVCSELRGVQRPPAATPTSDGAHPLVALRGEHGRAPRTGRPLTSVAEFLAWEPGKPFGRRWQACQNAPNPFRRATIQRPAQPALPAHSARRKKASASAKAPLLSRKLPALFLQFSQFRRGCRWMCKRCGRGGEVSNWHGGT
jgi:hypothetical protein